MISPKIYVETKKAETGSRPRTGQAFKPLGGGEFYLM
jgi:hypothetical protein